MSIALSTPGKPAVIPGESLSEWLRRWRDSWAGQRSWADVAREIGVKERMLQLLIAGSTGAGADTLGALLVWNPDLASLVLDELRSRRASVRSSSEAA